MKFETIIPTPLFDRAAALAESRTGKGHVSADQVRAALNQITGKTFSGAAVVVRCRELLQPGRIDNTFLI